MRTLKFSSSRRMEMIDITAEVAKAVDETGVKNGLCCIYIPHTTAGITINENADPSVKADILNSLEQLVPADESYSHTEGNADSHIKASLMGSSASVIVEAGRLKLGTWQGIFLCEFDGPRRREVYVKVYG